MEQNTNGILDSYKLGNFHFDEVFKENKEPKTHYTSLVERFNQFSLADFERINNEVKMAFFNQGITFAVYSEDKKPGMQYCYPSVFLKLTISFRLNETPTSVVTPK